MNEQISFEIKNDALAVIQSLDIEANFAEMEAALREMMEPYKSMVLTDMAAAKSARAYCNKVAKSINDSRLMVKKLYQEPLAAFEQKCKALTAICDEASGAIDAQIKAEEQKDRDIRINTLRNYFNSSVHGIEDYITFERIFNKKWENKSYGMANAEAEIDNAIEQTMANVEAIVAMHSPFETTLLLVLRETGDMGKVMQKKAACEAIEAKKEERAAERDFRAVESIGASDHAETPPPGEKREIGARTYTFTLTFEATKEQAFLINDFFKANGIKFRKVGGKNL